MRVLITCLVSLILAAVAAAQSDPVCFSRERLRQEYHLALKDPRLVTALLDRIESGVGWKKGECPAVVAAYYGALKELEARDVSGISRKWRSMQNGFYWLDKAVKSAPDDLEARFLRFVTLHNMPVILGVRKKSRQDIPMLYAGFIRRDYSIVDKITQAQMIRVLLASDQLSSAQETALGELLED